MMEIFPEKGQVLKIFRVFVIRTVAPGDAGDYPLSYSPYVEQYFISSDEEKSGNWTRIDFKDAKTDKSRNRYRKDQRRISGEFCRYWRLYQAGADVLSYNSKILNDKSKTDKYR